MRARAAASVLLAGLASATLAGCGFVTPIATQVDYAPSDGAQGRVGDVRVLNVLVITEDGEDGNLLFTAANNSGETVDLTVQYEAADGRTDRSVELAPATTTDFGFGENGQFLLENIDAPAGTLLPIYFQYGDEPGLELAVPVLDGSLPFYEELTPMPVPEPVVSETPAPEPTEPIDPAP